MSKLTKSFLIFKNKDLRRRFFFTAVMLIIVRALTQLPVPWIDVVKARLLMRGNAAFDFYNVLTGGGLEHFSIFALSISPYITASILMQLAAIIFPTLEEFQKDGEAGRRKLTKYTQRLSLVLAFAQALSIAYTFSLSESVISGSFPILTIALTLAAGSSILLWMGNKITEHGIGNGISLILLMNVLSRIPADFVSLYEQFIKDKGWTGAVVAIAILFLVVVIVFLTIVINEAFRRIPVQYSSKLAGKRNNEEHIPLKLNTSNVMPVVFASSMMTFPSIIIAVTGKVPDGLLGSIYHATMQQNWFVPAMWKLSVGYVVYIILLIFFAYFYTDMTFNPEEVADNLKRAGATIPNIRPGRETISYLEKTSKSLIFIGALALAFVATIPLVFSGLFSANVSFAGTSLIIAISIIVETSRQVETLLETSKQKLF